jgi:hypothetical protein
VANMSIPRLVEMLTENSIVMHRAWQAAIEAQSAALEAQRVQSTIVADLSEMLMGPRDVQRSVDDAPRRSYRRKANKVKVKRAAPGQGPKDYSRAGKEKRRQERIEILSHLPDPFTATQLSSYIPNRRRGVWLAHATHNGLIKWVRKGEYRKVREVEARETLRNAKGATQ